MSYAFWADVVVIVHTLFVAFVVLGELAILVGAAFGVGWVRNFWFRLAHLAAILFVGLEAVFGIFCPLTDWENQLRERAGQSGPGESFIAHALHAILMWDVPLWFLNALHIGFAVLVILTFVFIPPRWPRIARFRHAPHLR